MCYDERNKKDHKDSSQACKNKMQLNANQYC